MSEQRIMQMFEKDITRNIAGVIKVEQEEEEILFQELSEYIVTNEVKRYISDMFSAYLKSIDGLTDDIGIWISGFFGSGKSHFLKIMSYVLAGRIVKDRDPVSYLKEQIQDPMLLAEMKRASDGITHDIILFNIDVKADDDNRSIAAVFMKAFNEKCGYFGSIPWLAQMERKLDKNGQYETFKKCFKEISGLEWSEGRSDVFFNGDEIAEALVNCEAMSDVEANRWLDNAESQYSLSVEDFANIVNEYIDRKGPNHHVVFMVDEVGQYIGNNGDLMINLQSVTELLGVKCMGKAWVMVTSQLDIESALKIEFDGRQRRDFSKIQGRFKTRINLSGSNVDEVIKKRLLVKSKVAKAALEILYENKDATLRNLLTFSAETPTKLTYKNASDFADIYPFTPYQFKLLQSVFNGVRESGATGKHLAESERSLLGAFHETANKYAEEAMGFIVPFSSFYDTIEGFLEHNIRNVIQNAIENTSLNKFDIEILKLLFMLKYIKDLPSNLENLSTLMVSNIDTDKHELQNTILESLNRLVSQMVVQKNGDIYTFLTNDEQQINKTIQRIDIDSNDIQNTMAKSIFGKLFDETRFKVDEYSQYDFTRMIGGRDYGRRTGDMELEIITPLSFDVINNDNNSLAMTSARFPNRMIVVIDEDNGYEEEYKWMLRIDKYSTQIRSESTPMQQLILAQKGEERINRQTRGDDLLNEALSAADIYIAGHKIELRSTNTVGRMQEGLSYLAKSVYSKRDYIDKHYRTSRELEELCTNYRSKTLVDITHNKRAMEDMLDFVGRNNQRNIPTTFKIIVDRYTAAPYGWQELEISGVILQLVRDEKLELVIKGERCTTADSNVHAQLTKRTERESVKINIRQVAPKDLLQEVREIIKSITGTPPSGFGEEELLIKSKTEFTNIYNSAKAVLNRYTRGSEYPGRECIESLISRTEKFISYKNPISLFMRMKEESEAFKAEHTLYKRISAFFKNQFQHYDQANRNLRVFDRDKTFISDEELLRIVESISNIMDMDEPYSMMHEMPALNDQFEKRHRDVLAEKIIPINSQINDDWYTITSRAAEVVSTIGTSLHKDIYDDSQQAFGKAENLQQSFSFAEGILNLIGNDSQELPIKEFTRSMRAYTSSFKGMIESLRNVNDMPEVLAISSKSENARINALEELDRIETLSIEPDVLKQEKREKKLQTRGLLLPGSTISSVEDVENLLNKLREKLLSELNYNDTIRFI